MDGNATIARRALARAAALAVFTLIALYLRFPSGRIATAIPAPARFPGPNGRLQRLVENLGLDGYRTLSPAAFRPSAPVPDRS